MEFCSYFEQIADSPNFLRKLALKFGLRPKSLKLRHSSNWDANLFKIWQNSNASLSVAYLFFYHIPEVYRVDNYKIEKFKWCVWKTAFIPPIKDFFLFSTAVPQPLYIFSCKKQFRMQEYHFVLHFLTVHHTCVP